MKLFNHTIFSNILLITFLFTASSCKGQSGKKPKNTGNSAAISASVIKVGTDKVTFPVNDHLNGFNAQMMRGPSWKTPGFAEKVASLNPKLIRYPGGTVASFWDWKTGWLMNVKTLKKEWSNIPKSPILLDDLKFACDQTGANPVFVLNMVNSELSYQMEMLRYAKSIGLKVAFVELDNELYIGESYYVNRFPTGASYAQEANTWIQTIKKEFPGVKVGVVGYSSRESAAQKEKKNQARTDNWNSQVIQNIKNADGMTFHVYGGSGLKFIAKAAAKAAPATDDDEDGVSPSESYQTAFEKPGSVGIILGNPYARWNSASTYDYKLLPPGMKAWITEYNLFEKEGVVAGTWTHGLYAISQTLMFMENPLTELFCYHNLTTSAQFAAIYNNAQGLDKAVKKQPTTPLTLTAPGHTLELAGKFLKHGGTATKLQFPGNPQLAASRGQKYPALNGWMVAHAKGKSVIVINLSSESKKIDCSGLLSGSITWNQKHAAPLKQIAKDGDVKLAGGSGSMVNLEPYSVTLIEGN
jgi:hypothetical protein